MKSLLQTHPRQQDRPVITDFVRHNFLEPIWVFVPDSKNWRGPGITAVNGCVHGVEGNTIPDISPDTLKYHPTVRPECDCGTNGLELVKPTTSRGCIYHRGGKEPSIDAFQVIDFDVRWTGQIALHQDDKEAWNPPSAFQRDGDRCASHSGTVSAWPQILVVLTHIESENSRDAPFRTCVPAPEGGAPEESRQE